jgi:hypothetical protein
MLYQVKVSCDTNGNIAVNPDTITITLDDTIEWVGDGGIDFAIVFPYPRRPFQLKVLYKNLNSGRPIVGPSKTIHYKYEVHACGVVLDPEVIVEEPKP